MCKYVHILYEYIRVLGTSVDSVVCAAPPQYQAYLVRAQVFGILRTAAAAVTVLVKFFDRNKYPRKASYITITSPWYGFDSKNCIVRALLRCDALL